MREHLPDGRLDWQARAKRGLTALLRADLRFAMPPQPAVWVGREENLHA